VTNQRIAEPTAAIANQKSHSAETQLQQRSTEMQPHNNNGPQSREVAPQQPNALQQRGGGVPQGTEDIRQRQAQSQPNIRPDAPSVTRPTPQTRPEYQSRPEAPSQARPTPQSRPEPRARPEEAPRPAPEARPHEPTPHPEAAPRPEMAPRPTAAAPRSEPTPRPEAAPRPQQAPQAAAPAPRPAPTPHAAPSGGGGRDDHPH
jgi:hypothetical protein